VEQAGWTITLPAVGQKLARPEPLFTKLDDSVIETENSRLEQSVLAPG
jgi:hypothetical protein